MQISGAMTKRQIAEKNFIDGCNCTQAVVMAFADELGVDRDILVKVSSSFGGGFGRLREVCGAVSAMGIIVGLLEGKDFSKEGIQAKGEQYAKIQKLAGEFKEINGSIVCRDLLGAKLAATNPQPDERTPEYYKIRPCAKLVGDMAEIIAKYLHIDADK